MGVQVEVVVVIVARGIQREMDVVVVARGIQSEVEVVVVARGNHHRPNRLMRMRNSTSVLPVPRVSLRHLALLSMVAPNWAAAVSKVESVASYLAVRGEILMTYQVPVHPVVHQPACAKPISPPQL